MGVAALLTATSRSSTSASEDMSKRRPQKTKRYFERRANNLRAAWNRVGQAFGLRKEELDQAKRLELSPHRILRHKNEYTADSVRMYIQRGGAMPREYDSMADYLVDREIDRLTEIARLEQESLGMDEILERVGENWW